MTNEVERAVTEIIELEDAEREAMAVLRRRAHSMIKNLFIESSDLKQVVGNLVAYEIKGRLDLVTKPKGFLRKEKVEERDFKIMIDVSTGKCIGARA